MPILPMKESLTSEISVVYTLHPEHAGAASMEPAAQYTPVTSDPMADSLQNTLQAVPVRKPAYCHLLPVT